VLIIGAGVAASKIRPEAQRILHVAAEVLRSIAVITATIVAVAIAAWVLAYLVRWWLRHRDPQPGKAHPTTVTAWPPARTVTGQRLCLACGGNGEVLRADSVGYFEPRACPECQPARLAG
jgi:phosphate/sulfate permease